MKVDCFKCKYDGGHIVERDLYECKCDKVVEYGDLFNEDRQYVECNRDNCEHYIPHIDIEDEDIEEVCSLNVTHRCPYCGEEDTEYDADGEDTKIITCSNCGKQYEISWCIYLVCKK